jgi:hypothetical protein
MSTVKTIEYDVGEYHGTALIASDDSIWIAINPKWWDLATFLWWWFCPYDRKAWVVLNTTQGRTVRTKAIRVATKHVRIRKIPEPF